MADNPPEPPRKAQPPLPSSGTTGRFKAPTTKLPPPQAGVTGKVVVMLSSVAKPTGSQKILPPPVIPGSTPLMTGPMASPVRIAPPLTPASSSQIVRQAPPPLPARHPMPVAKPLPAEQRLSSTTFVKLPPKTAAPAFVSLVPRAAVVPEKVDAAKPDAAKVAPPLLPPKRAEPLKAPEPAKSEKKKTGIIKLNTPGATSPVPVAKPTAVKPDDSIFDEIPEPVAPPVPEGWDKLHTGELPLPVGGLKDSDPFQQSSRIEPKPAAKPAAVPPPLPVAKDKPAEKIADKPAAATTPAPPLAADPTPVTAKSEPTLNPAPVPLQSAHPIHVAPPLIEKSHEEAPSKLAQPHMPEPAPEPPALKTSEPAPAPKIPEPPKIAELKKADPAKPAAPAAVSPAPPPPVPAGTAKDQLKKSEPIMLATTTRIPIPGVGGGNPALRPAVLPSRLRTAAEVAAASAAAAATAADKSTEITAKTTSTPAIGPAKIEPASKVEASPKIEAPKTEPAKDLTAKSPEKESTHLPPSLPTDVEIAAGAAAAGGTVAAVTPSKKKSPKLPPTRAERAKNRQYRGVIIFWVLVPIVALALFFGILYFGRDTRVEGQVIPPQGMTLADEVWIVSDFNSLASGVADDVAKERVPLQQAIQEAQDHVQRVQSDIATREERIRLIQDNIQAAKDEITNLVKKSQTDSQAIYDGQGRELDSEYNSKIAALKQTIADRAASLKLQYAPDPAFPSPEVWANAYRLALYETPPGVDGVKEHQWIADQMKGWRDFEKSMDDRYQQMREQAAQLKQSSGPRITDINTKIDDLNGRISATQAEEDPLKAELVQAQKDLAQAQSVEASLDEKYYGQLDALPVENVSYRIPVRPDGRFTWVPDHPFGEGEIEHNYIIFSRAIRADGRQYWALHPFSMKKDEITELTLEPGGYESTKQILRPNLSPDEIEQ